MRHIEDYANWELLEEHDRRVETYNDAFHQLRLLEIVAASRVAEDIGKKTELLFVSIGRWTCRHSVFDRCVYDDLVDKSHDDCLYCGQPEERK